MSERGWEFWTFSLAHFLGMTRRQLFNSLDSYELSCWFAYMSEIQKKHERKQSKAEIEGNLKTFLGLKGAKGVKHGRKK